jgi:ketosteroid isomerase-like protein
MHKRIFLLTAVLSMMLAVLVRAGDKEDIEALIQQYSMLEDAGDMRAQAQLMAANRTWIGPGAGRRTDNAAWMKLQQDFFDDAKKLFPGVRFLREVRDLQVRLYGSVAVASFYWYTNRFIPGDMPQDKVKLLGPDPTPIAVTHVLAKEGNAWKIAHTHISDLYPPGGAQ